MVQISSIIMNVMCMYRQTPSPMLRPGTTTLGDARSLPQVQGHIETVIMLSTPLYKFMKLLLNKN